MDRETAAEFAARLRHDMRGGAMSATVDLSGVEQFSSAGIRALAELAHDASTSGERLRVVAPDHSVAGQVLRLVGMQSVVELAAES